MKLASEKTIGIIEYAIGRENESLQFYTACLDKAKTEGTKTVLSGLVEDEKKHKAMMEKLLKAARESFSVDDIQTESGPGARERLNEAFPHGSVKDADFEAESASVRDTLEKALEKEKESFDTYSSAAHNAEEDEVRGIFDFLAKEENIHYNLVENLMSYLSDPGNWLYEEENLVFRRG